MAIGLPGSRRCAMCQFCTEHGEGKKWYLQMKNDSEDLLHSGLSAEGIETTRAGTRAEWLARFMECFEKPAALGIPKTLAEIGMAISIPFQGPSYGFPTPLKRRNRSVDRKALPLKMKVVEAAGVEPASEKACRDEPTCVSGSVYLGRRFKTGKTAAAQPD